MPDDRVEAGLVRGSGEANRAVQALVIGQGEAGQAQLEGALDQVLDARRAVEEREVGVAVELGEGTRHSADNRTSVLESKTRAPARAKRARLRATINGHARSSSRRPLARLRLRDARAPRVRSVVSSSSCVAAVWLVFVGVPTSGAGADARRSLSPPNPSHGATARSTGSAAGSPATASPAPARPAATELRPNPLAKQVPAHSVDPTQLTGYIWPVKHALITTRFAPLPATDGGFVIIDGVAYHDGIDLATHCDDKVRAAHDGTVLYAGRDYDPYLGYQGNAEAIYDRLQKLGHTNEQPIVVVIDDGNGYRSEYVHLNEADVEPGQVVKAGDVIGLEGATGFATGCHLHFSLIRMDGGWQPVVTRLLQYGYPPLVRERVNPLDVLPWGDPNAPQRLQDKVNPPSPTPIPNLASRQRPLTSSPEIQAARSNHIAHFELTTERTLENVHRTGSSRTGNASHVSSAGRPTDDADGPCRLSVDSCL